MERLASDVNPRFQDALVYAVRAHASVMQARKGTDFPYVAHPIRVAEILDRFGYGDDVVVAGFLHDNLEDTEVTREEIDAAFSPAVGALVAAVSEPDKSLPWKARKEHAIAALRAEEPDVLALKAADKLDNVRAITETLRHLGEEGTWALFREGRSEQHWYYRSIAAALLEGDPESRLFRTLDYETQRLFPDKRRTTRFFAGKPLGTPHDARRYLADPIKHWRPAHSAMELAKSWIESDGFPTSVRHVLETSDTYVGCELLEGFFEREVELNSPGRPSQTDLLVLARLRSGIAVIAVEGKAREPFGDVVSVWNTTPGKQRRLDDLCQELGLEPSTVGGLRYQLLHRTVSALIEARRYGAPEALMLVHSFDAGDASLQDYLRFAEAMGMAGAATNAITEPKPLGDITLRLGWVKER